MDLGSGRASRGAAAGLTDPYRLRAVEASGLLDLAGLESLDRLAALASKVLQARSAFVTVVDDRRSWWVACVGVSPPAAEVRQSRVEDSFCQYVVAEGAPVIIDDTSTEPRTAGNPSIAALGVRAWAGFPLAGPDGETLGSFCVADTQPRTWTEHQIEILGALAQAASAQIAVVKSAHAERAATEAAEQARALSGHTADLIHNLARTAIEMTSADTYDELARVVVDRGLALLAADGGALIVREGDDTLRAVLSPGFTGYGPPDLRDQSLYSVMPGTYSARSGQRVLLPTRADGLAFSPLMADVYEQTGTSAWAFLPLRTGTEALGSLAMSWNEEHELDPDELVLLDSFAAQCSQAVYRIQQLTEAKVRARSAQQLSESLQRSLLTQPPTPASLRIAVRYQPAAEAAQVGGDWHDAFVTADGATTTLVVGDVTGHDRMAAAAMAQIRNLLRGISYRSTDGPAGLLSLLDSALEGLEVGALATAVLAQIDHTDPDASPATRRLRWSNAGHLAPLLRRPDGTVEVLERPAELMLGVDPTVPRTEHCIDLEPGSVLLLYTDGLVEGRHASLDEGISQLAAVLRSAPREDPESICDALLEAGIVTDSVDDVAMLALYLG